MHHFFLRYVYKVLFLRQHIDSTLKNIFQDFHNSDAKQPFDDFRQKIIGCQTYCSFAYKNNV